MKNLKNFSKCLKLQVFNISWVIPVIEKKINIHNLRR